MPVIAPFKALRYAPTFAGQMAKLVAPPYDVISPAEQDALHAAHANNVVRLDLAKETRDADRYANAARDLEDWLGRGLLTEDDRPALYVYAQRFTLPTGEEQIRQGFIAAVRLEAPGEGVRAHEQTLSAPLEDRFKLMMATHATFSQVFALYKDADRAIDRRLAEVRGEPLSQFRTPDGVQHTLWRVTDPAAIAFAGERLAHEALVIADGHHRYETALRYRDAMRARHPDAGPDASFEYLPVFLCSAADPGLTILPTHRMLAPGTELNPDKLIEGLSRYFFVTQRLTPPATRHGARLFGRELLSASEKGPCFAVSVPRMPTTLVCIQKPNLDLSGVSTLPPARSLRSLDVTALHALCLEPLLGITPELARQGRLEYEHDTAAALGRLAGGQTPAIFFLPPTRIEQVFEVARDGERMPQKSTYFYPKLASGLVMHRVSPKVALQRA